jgi:hypothetical protein
MTTEERVKRLEREVRWTRVGGAVTAVALACVVLVGAGQEQDKPEVLDEVRARSFMLVDEAGSSRAVLKTFDGGTSLVLRAKDGKNSVYLGTENGAAKLSLYDGGTRVFPRVMLSAHGDRNGFLCFWDPAKSDVPPKGPSMGLMFDSGETNAFFVANREGNSAVFLGCESRDRIAGRPNPGPLEPRLSMLGAGGAVLVELPKSK